MQQIPIDLTQTENNRLTVIADVERKKISLKTIIMKLETNTQIQTLMR
jgi:hypothetical protein